MPTEFRRIVFPNKAVEKSIRLAVSRTGLEVYHTPQGKLMGSELMEDCMRLTFAHPSTGVETHHDIPMLHAAAMLILYCSHDNIPVPREAQKFLSQVGDHVALDLYIQGEEKLLANEDVSHGFPIQPYALDEALSEASEQMMEAMAEENWA